jgi:hypothetical protein
MGVNIWENRGKLYLDIWHNGRRKRESLGLTIPADKTQRAEIMRLAEVCKSKREAQILSGEWGPYLYIFIMLLNRFTINTTLN